MPKNLNQTKEDEYEKYVIEKLRPEYDNIWLLDYIPESVLRESKIIINRDTYLEFKNEIGIDIIAIKDGKYTYIKCKNCKNICTDDLAYFFFFMITHNTSATLCYSNKIDSSMMDQLRENEDKMELKITLNHIPFDNKINKQ